MIYLDHAATTPTDERVIEAMAQCMREAWQNPSAAYAASGLARRALRQARRTLAEMVGADPGEVVFTSGGTEANNLALQAARGGHVVLSAIEHASVLNAARALGCEVTPVNPDARGRIDPGAVERALRRDTKLISVQFANNETGVLQPVAEIGALARARGIPFHCDAVQAFGHVPVSMPACKIDLLSLSAHKFYGPRGAGALIARQGTPLTPLLYGGGQEFGLRAGTENVPAIAGMAMAAALAREDLDERAQRERALMDGFLTELRGLVPGMRALGGDAPRLPGVASVLIPGTDSEVMIGRLDLMGVQVSGGAACASREHLPSHVYRAMGLTEAEAKSVLRVSIGRATTAEALSFAAQAIKRAAEASL